MRRHVFEEREAYSRQPLRRRGLEAFSFEILSSPGHQHSSLYRSDMACQASRQSLGGLHTSMSKSSSILTTCPKRKTYCMRLANSHMFRSLVSVSTFSGAIAGSTGISRPAAAASRLYLGMVVGMALMAEAQKDRQEWYQSSTMTERGGGTQTQGQCPRSNGGGDVVNYLDLS